MKVMLDTNICIYIINDRSSSLRKILGSLRTGDIGISAITLCELSTGASLNPKPEESAISLRKFVAPLIVAPLDAPAAECYGALHAGLKNRGTTIGPMDLLIAAHAKSLDVTLVTNNVRDFRRVPGLRIENWV